MNKTLTIEELKNLKDSYGITYEAIQKNCSLSLSTVQKAFGGINKHPRLSTLEELSNAMEKLLPAAAMSANPGIPHTSAPYTYVTPNVDPPHVSEAARYYSKGSSALSNTGNSTNQEIYTQSGYTYDDYLKLELPDGKRVEIIDGVIYDMSAPTLRHQDVVLFVSIQFHNFIKKNKGNCHVYAAPVDVRLEFDTTDMTVVQPDVLVICDRTKAEDGKAIKGAPDFVMEVLSPSSRKIDMNLKLQKYRETGVREYWIVDYDAGIVIKNVFDKNNIPDSASSSDAKTGEWSRMYTLNDTIPVEIYEGKLAIDFNEIREYVES